MKNLTSFRFRKCSDVNMDLPFFEVLDNGEEVIMDISESNSGERCVLFHDACAGQSISIKLLYEIITEACDLLDEEK